MIPTLTRILMSMAIVAMFVPQVMADAPELPAPAAVQDSQVQQVGHQCPGECCQSDCCQDGCNYCGCGKSGCSKCKAGCKCPRCKKCRMTLLDRLRCRNLFNIGMGFGTRGRDFGPKGCGGKGCPPIGMYQMVYPVNPDYFDGRDGQVHAAQGYGVPMAVPLAPVVRHQYNYSWGVPASRITHISNHAPHLMHGPQVIYGMNSTLPIGPDGAVNSSGYGGSYCPQCQSGGY